MCHQMQGEEGPTALAFAFINNLVYARDPTILQDRISCMNIRNLMQHENILDINSLF